MVQVLESSAERRLRDFRRGRTLDLFTRHGPFWDRVAAMRRRWGVEPEARIPPQLLVRRVHAPKDLRRAFQQPWPAAAEERFIRWALELEALHNAVVSPPYQVPGRGFASADFWDGFLSGCVVYDPPAGDLLGYADAPTAEYSAYLELFEGEGDEGLTMLAPPIRYWEDPDAVVARERARHDRILAALGARLAQRGIDIRELVDHLEYGDRTAEEHGQILPGPRPCIVVETHTTDADVRAAFRILARGRPERPRPLRPRRDPLTALQCAVWHDDLGWGHEAIARRFGWTVQYPAGAKPRSETVRQHVAEGRDLRAQRWVAA